ncbi:unnamed protein product [Closterium sp. NIES-54]
MQPQRRLRESLTPQQLREWYAGWGCRGGDATPTTTPAASTRGGGQMQLPRPSRVSLTPRQLREWYAQSGESLSAVRCSYVIRTGTRTGQPCGTPSHTQSRCFARLSDAWRTVFGDDAELPDWVELLRQRVDIYALDYDAILTAMYALPTSADRAGHLCVPPDPGIGPAALDTGEAAALGASESPAPGTGAAAALGASEPASSGAGEAALSGTALTSASLTFTLDSGASRSFFRDRTTLTPLGRPVAVSLADPSGGPVLAHFSTVLPCPAAPSGTLSGLYLPSFSTNLVSGADLQDAAVHQFTPASQRVTHCTDARTGRHLATFSRRRGSSLYTLTTESPPVPASGQVAASGQVFAAASRSGPESAPCSCRLLSHETLLWHHRLGHPSLPRLRGMASRVLVSGLPQSLPPLPSGPGPSCVPCVEARLRAAPHSSQFPPTEAPLQTLNMDVWGPAPVRGQGHERYFLLVVDDYSRYTSVFPLRSKGAVTEELREWFARRWRRAAGAGASSTVEGAGAAGPGAAGPAGTTRAGAAEGVGAETTAVCPRGGSAAGAAGGPAAGGVGGAGAVAEGAGAVPAESGAAARPRPYFVPLLQEVLGLSPLVECPLPVQSQSLLEPSSPLPAPSPYTGPTGGLAERREPASRPASPVRAARASGRGSRQRPPPVPGTHRMSLRPSTAPLRAPLPSPPKSSLPALADPESDSLRAASPTVTRLLATVVTDPSFESTAASALVAELVDFAARCRLDYAASLVAESASVCPPSVGGECALGTDVLEDRQEELQCLAAASPHLASVLLAPKGDPDALDIPTPRSYAEAVEGPYSSQWQAAMDAEMASWKSTGTYVDAVPPPGANIVSGMWIFKVKRPPGSPPVFKARYVARGFSQRQGVDYFQTFSPTPKMTTLRVLLHIAAQRDYELHSLDFSTAFLQGSLHEEIWLRRPPGFTRTFPPGTQWSLRRPVYGLRQAPREWHDTLRTTLAALGFAPSTADPKIPTAMGGPPGSRAPRQGRVAGGGGGLGVGVRGAGAGEGLRSSDGGGGAGGSKGSGGGGHGNGGGRPRKTSRLLLHIRVHYRRLLLRGGVALAALLLLALLLRAALRLGGGAGGEGAAPTGRSGRGGSNRKLGAPGDGGSGEGRGEDGRGGGKRDVARGGTGQGEAAGNRGTGLVSVALDRGDVGLRRGRGTDVYEASREGEIVNAWDSQYGLEIDVWDPRTHNPLKKQLSELGSEVQVAGGKDKAHYLVAMVVHHLNRSSNISLYECRQWVEYYKYAGVSHVVWYDTSTDSRDSIEAAWRPYIRDGFLTLHSFRHLFPSFDPHGAASKDDQATLHFLTTHGPQTAWFVRLPVTSFLFAPGDVKPGFLDRFLREYEAHRQQASQLLLQMLPFVGPGQRPLPALLLERFVHRTEQTRGASLQPFAQMTAVVKPDSVLRLFWHHPHHLEMSKGDTVVLPAALLRVHSFEKAVTGEGVEGEEVVADTSMLPLAIELNQMLNKDSGVRQRAGGGGASTRFGQ